MLVSDIVSRVAALLDDPEQSYCTDDWILGFAQNEYEALYNKLKLCGTDFDDIVIELPNVAAGTPDLSAFLAPGAPLEFLVTPRMLEWKLAGAQPSSYRRADGPLDQIRDLDQGIVALDSWSWTRRILKLSAFNAPLDLRLTGDFLFDPLNSPDSKMEYMPTANPVLVFMIAATAGDVRGNDKWSAKYRARADEAFDDLAIALTKGNLPMTRRLQRICRGNAMNGSRNVTPYK